MSLRCLSRSQLELYQICPLGEELRKVTRRRTHRKRTPNDRFDQESLSTQSGAGCGFAQHFDAAAHLHWSLRESAAALMTTSLTPCDLVAGRMPLPLVSVDPQQPACACEAHENLFCAFLAHPPPPPASLCSDTCPCAWTRLAPTPLCDLCRSRLMLRLHIADTSPDESPAACAC